jgi:hypothetical protein
MSAIYLWTEDRQTGPFNLEEIRMFLQSGKASPQTLCCRDGDPQWKPLADLADLKSSHAEKSPIEACPPRAEQRFVNGWVVDSPDKLDASACTLKSVAFGAFFLAGFFITWFLIAGFGSEHFNASKAAVPATLSACSFIAGFCFQVLAQLLHIRASIDRQNR